MTRNRTYFSHGTDTSSNNNSTQNSNCQNHCTPNKPSPLGLTFSKGARARPLQKTTMLGYSVLFIMAFGDELLLLPSAFTAGRHYQKRLSQVKQALKITA